MPLPNLFNDFPLSAYFVRPATALTMALINPGIVNCLAAISTGRPSSRSVADVTGPIEAIRTSDSCLWRPLLVPPSNSTKFLTVEELVNVTTCGRCLGIL